MFIPSIFKSVQQVAFTGVANGSVIALGTPVVVANTILLVNGFASTDASGFPDGGGLGLLQLTGVSSVTVTMSFGASDVSFFALEFYPGFLRSAVQYGIITLTGITSNSNIITAVGPKAIAFCTGMSTDGGVTQVDMASVTGSLYLSSTTSVTASRNGTGGAASPTTSKVGYCILDPR